MINRREFRNAEQELRIQKQIQELAKIYLAAQKGIKAELRRLDITDFRRSRSEAILKEINLILRGLNFKSRQWAEKAIPDAYRRGFDLAGEQLKKMRVTSFVDFDKPIHTSAVGILVDDITFDLVYANNSIERNVNRFIRETQQRILEDKEISRMIAEGVVRGETRRAVSDSLLESFRKRMAEEQFITINGRNYRPDYYAELIARTRGREASSQGTINTALAYDVDLVQWSVHSGACPVCQDLQGKIFSISGTNDDFPALTSDTTPPAHPHCAHVLTPVLSEVLRKRGQYEGLSRFSRGGLKAESFKQFLELIR